MMKYNRMTLMNELCLESWTTVLVLFLVSISAHGCIASRFNKHSVSLFFGTVCSQLRVLVKSLSCWEVANQNLNSYRAELHWNKMCFTKNCHKACVWQIPPGKRVELFFSFTKVCPSVQPFPRGF